MNEWKKKWVGLQRTLVSKRTVQCVYLRRPRGRFVPTVVVRGPFGTPHELKQLSPASSCVTPVSKTIAEWNRINQAEMRQNSIQLGDVRIISGQNNSFGVFPLTRREQGTKMNNTLHAKKQRICGAIHEARQFLPKAFSIFLSDKKIHLKMAPFFMSCTPTPLSAVRHLNFRNLYLFW